MDMKPNIDLRSENVAANELMNRLGIKKSLFYELRKKGYFQPDFCTPSGRNRYCLRSVAGELAVISADIEAAKIASRTRRGRPRRQFSFPSCQTLSGGT